MTHPLLDRDTIDHAPEEYLRSIGTVFAEFGELTQDSGNISYGLQIGGDRYFVKTAGIPHDPRPYLDHPARVGLLRNAARISHSCDHPILATLYRVIESPCGPLLVYPWLDGDLLGTPRQRRDDPGSPYQRFRSLPVEVIARALDAVYDLHACLAQTGWISCDFYDGCLLFDFHTNRIHVVDLDMYQSAPLTNTMGRMFGSTRFMAPEEFELGAMIDEQTTVFVMGRCASLFLSDGTLNPAAFRGSAALFEVVQRACSPERHLRFGRMADFYRAWKDARSDFGQAGCDLRSTGHLI